ncbi:hypothetical protein KQX64_17800 [Rhodopseudomonas palustris]|nr:hypothetical protein KQX64_17800 [Rhodopseudomonas palustris]
MARLNRSTIVEEGQSNRLPLSQSEQSPEVIPEVTEGLINYLNRTFPNALPPAGSPYTEVERAWGRREVIDHLIGLKEQIEQENHVLRRRINSTPSGSAGPTAAASG